MQRLRHARFLARLVLVWFALAVGVAVAAPVVGASSLELVCSGSAIKLMVKGDDGSTRPIGHTLDCPLCVSMDGPPAAAGARSFPPLATSSPVEAIVSTRVAAQTAVPPPARAPPSQA